MARRRVTKAGRKPLKSSPRWNTRCCSFSLPIEDKKVLTHRQILRELWGPKAEGQTHYLRTYMLRLRRKLEDDLDAPKYFQTESGIGYRFLGDQAAAD